MSSEDFGYMHVADYVIFLGTLVISVAIGVYFAFADGGQKTTKQFLLGDRNMPVLPTALSLMVSFLSGILVLGISSEMYMKGTNFIFHVFGMLVALPIAAIVYLPIFYKLKLTSAYEYLEMRYESQAIRLIGSTLFVISTVLYMAIVMYAPATALNGLTGINLELLIAVSGILCTFYTAIGGLKAVVWTDAFQALIMYAGFIAIVLQGTIQVGGVGKVWAIASEGGRLVASFDPNPFTYMTVWSSVIGTAFGWVATYTTNQTAVQRYTSVSSLRKAQLSLFLVLPGMLTMMPLVCMVGIVMYAYYANCDPLVLGKIKNRDQLLPYFTTDVLADFPGTTGLFLACLYSGTLSTISSGLNSIAAVVWTDFIQPTAYGSRIADNRATQLNKAIACAFGFIAIGFACVAQHLGGVLQASMTILSAGALVGVVGSSAVMCCIAASTHFIKPYQSNLVQSIIGCSNETLLAAGFNSSQALISVTSAPDVELTGILYVLKLSFKYYGTAGILLVFLFGAPISIITSKFKVNTAAAALMWPGLGKICCCLLPAAMVQEMEKVDGIKERIEMTSRKIVPVQQPIYITQV
uniref:Sodium-coupled monocarboxylate transporter 1 n=1 Tax=Plectus sambesii TaxID=2011161 RepID=A0A914UKK3_9BILA